MRRRWRSSSPRARKLANAYCSMRAVPQSSRSLAPARPGRGARCLAAGAGVDDPIGLQALKGPDRGSVVAVLGVVVVLDHDRIAGPEPCEERGAPGAGRGSARPVVVG